MTTRRCLLDSEVTTLWHYTNMFIIIIYEQKTFHEKEWS